MRDFNQPNQHVRRQNNAGRDININNDHRHNVGRNIYIGNGQYQEASRDIHNEHNYPLYVPPRRSTEQALISTLIGLIVFVSIIGVGAYLFLHSINTSSNLNINTAGDPKDTLSGFCSNLGDRQNQEAYDKYSSRLKAQISPADFTAQWADKQGISCVVNITSSSDQQAQGTIAMTPFASKTQTDYQVTLIKEGNAWKIDSINQQ